jgi:hypothetical protein
MPFPCALQKPLFRGITVRDLIAKDTTISSPNERSGGVEGSAFAFSSIVFHYLGEEGSPVRFLLSLFLFFFSFFFITHTWEGNMWNMEEKLLIS